MNIFVLIVITQVYVGNVVAMQEFSSQTTCESAKAQILKHDHLAYVVRIECVPK
jgi:hypothetical protein